MYEYIMLLNGIVKEWMNKIGNKKANIEIT